KVTLQPISQRFPHYYIGYGCFDTPHDNASAALRQKHGPGQFSKFCRTKAFVLVIWGKCLCPIHARVRIIRALSRQPKCQETIIGSAPATAGVLKCGLLESTFREASDEVKPTL